MKLPRLAGTNIRNTTDTGDITGASSSLDYYAYCTRISDTDFKVHLRVPPTSQFFVPLQKCVQCSPMVLFTHNDNKECFSALCYASVTCGFCCVWSSWMLIG